MDLVGCNVGNWAGPELQLRDSAELWVSLECLEGILLQAPGAGWIAPGM